MACFTCMESPFDSMVRVHSNSFQMQISQLNSFTFLNNEEIANACPLNTFWVNCPITFGPLKKEGATNSNSYTIPAIKAELKLSNKSKREHALEAFIHYITVTWICDCKQPKKRITEHVSKYIYTYMDLTVYG